MSLELHLRIAGTLLILLAAAHLFFPKELGWKEDLAKLTPEIMSQDIGVPFHPGAAKWYKEKGIAVK